MKRKFVVLLSGGLDSSANLFEAHRTGEVVLAINFNYGQKAAVPEKTAATNLTQLLGIKFKSIELPWFNDFGRSALIQNEQSIPRGKDIDIQDHHQSLKTARSVWVPNRNGIFLNIAAGFAEALEAEAIVPGFNLEEAQTFPDNSADFMMSLNQSFSYSTANQVKVTCFTSELHKPEILRRCIELKIPLEKMWPCYDSKEKWCGVCESCQRAKRAFEINKLETQKYFLE